jgi:hypothetical protein
LDPNWEFQKICYLREPLVLIVVMEGFYFDTQESELELVGYTRPTKAPWKDKREVHCKLCAPKFYGRIIQPPFYIF